MDTEFISLQLTRSEALELHAALVERAMLEDELRREKGLEPVASRSLLEKMDMLVSLQDAQEDKLVQALDDELWEFSWYRFTDEWAWFRAKQEIEQELGDDFTTADVRDIQRRIERRYERDFEQFVKEIEMQDEPSSSGSSKTQRKTA